MWGGRDDITSITAVSGNTIHNRRGKFHHNDMIGQPYGSKIWSQNRVGWFFALAPTAELWFKALKFRTQILYQTDISAICHYLDLRPGDIVVESGTGSGALTTAMARCISPDGKLFTFEYNKNRVAAAKEDFVNNKMDGIVDVTWRDVCKDGFRLNNVADAVFLDLPAPWDVVDSANDALVDGGRLCSFSPCIEQVQRVCVRLHQLGYGQIETIECLIRPHEVYSNPMQSFSFEDQSLVQQDATAVQKKRKIDEQGNPSQSATESIIATTTTTTSEPTIGNNSAEDTTNVADDFVEAPKKRAPNPARLKTVDVNSILTKPAINIAGHTGFLTFARKPPAVPKPMSE